MLDNPMIRPEWEYPESASLDDGPEYDPDEELLKKILSKEQ